MWGEAVRSTGVDPAPTRTVLPARALVLLADSDLLAVDIDVGDRERFERQADGDPGSADATAFAAPCSGARTTLISGVTAT